MRISEKESHPEQTLKIMLFSYANNFIGDNMTVLGIEALGATVIRHPPHSQHNEHDSSTD